VLLAYTSYYATPAESAVFAIIALAFYIGIPLLFALGGWNMANSRGRHQWGWAIASFFTGFIGLIALAVVGETQAVKQQRADLAAERAARFVNASR
jgi:uncharacterized membrane protein YbhN (UPF0104 family)